MYNELKDLVGTEVKVLVTFNTGAKGNFYVDSFEGDVLAFKKYWKSDIFNCHMHDIVEVEVPDEKEYFMERRVK